MMYARPELEPAHERLWALLRAGLIRRGIDAPEHLSKSTDEFSIWEDPALVLAQTCGMPYRTRLHTHVALVGTPDYGLEGCPHRFYRSVILVRKDDPRGALRNFANAKLAFNMRHSQSGFAAIYAHAQADGFWFAASIQSGSHLSSARMVADGRADIAALDAQTWRIIQRYEDWTDRLRVLDHTVPTPGLPYITGRGNDPDAVFDAVTEAYAALRPEDAETLDVKGFLRVPHDTYLSVATPPEDAGSDHCALRKHTM
jgi:ABC-type phosphate/phosphonate transport system substrate-binding protein